MFVFNQRESFSFKHIQRLLKISKFLSSTDFSKQGQKQFGSLVERQLYIAGQFYIVSITTQFIYRGAGEDIAGVS